MRFEQPSYATEVHGQHVPDCCRDIEEGAAFCIPADGVHCASCKWDAKRGVCFRNDCDALFTPRDLRKQQREWRADPQPQLIITAGPERSGSTWLFNAVRLLFQHANKPLDAYWLKDVTDAALDARGVGQPGGHHVLLKTHAWSDSFQLERATHVFVTHRDLRQVLASFRRMTWEYELPASYVNDHFRWRQVAELDLGFEDIIARPEALLRDLTARLGLQHVDYSAVLRDLCSLPVPRDWVDPVTQIWPSHISGPYMEARARVAAGGATHDPGRPSSSSSGEEGERGGKSLEEAMGAGVEPPTPTKRGQLDAEAADALLDRFPEFFKLYGYA